MSKKKDRKKARKAEKKAAATKRPWTDADDLAFAFEVLDSLVHPGMIGAGEAAQQLLDLLGRLTDAKAFDGPGTYANKVKDLFN